MCSAVSHRQPVDDVAEDVLVEIFSYIDGDQLLNLQIVCRRWHRVISSLINWKFVLKQKLRSSVTWRQVEKRLDHSAPETRFDYRLLYRHIQRNIQELDFNWRSGRFSEFDIEINDEASNSADDDFLVNFKDGNVVVYDRQRLEILHKMTGHYASCFSRLHKGRLFLTQSGRGYKIVDAKTGNEITKLESVKYIKQVSTRDWRLMTIVSEGSVMGNSLLQVRTVTADASEFVHETEYDRRKIRIELDDQLTAIFTVDFRISWEHRKVVIFFIDHFHVLTRSFGIRIGGRNDVAFHYGQGIFFLIHKNGSIRLMDVSTGQWLRTIRHKPWISFADIAIYLHWTPIALNSKFMATLEDSMANSIINIYDLVAAKDPSADSGGLLLFTIHVPGFHFRDMQMNETEIYGIGENKSRGGHVFFKALNFLDSGTGHEVICSIAQGGHVVRKPTRRPSSSRRISFPSICE